MDCSVVGVSQVAKPKDFEQGLDTANANRSLLTLGTITNFRTVQKGNSVMLM